MSLNITSFRNLTICMETCIADCLTYKAPNNDLIYQCEPTDDKSKQIILITSGLAAAIVVIVIVLLLIICIKRRTKHSVKFNSDNVTTGIEVKKQQAIGSENFDSNVGIVNENCRLNVVSKGNVTISTNNRKFQPQQILQNFLRGKLADIISKPISEIELKDHKAVLGNKGEDISPQVASEKGTSPLASSPKRRNSALRYNYRQLKQKEMSQFQNNCNIVNGSEDSIR
jgi:hypothetical protein